MKWRDFVFEEPVERNSSISDFQSWPICDSLWRYSFQYKHRTPSQSVTSG
jgi:hypothetical protein